MYDVKGLAGGPAVISSTAAPGQDAGAAIAGRSRDERMTIGDLADRYMREYPGRDTTRVQRIDFWPSLAPFGCLTSPTTTSTSRCRI